MFWDTARKYSYEEIGVAVDDRCHGEVAHMAKVISVGVYLCYEYSFISLLAQPRGEDYVYTELGTSVCWAGEREE